ncbi:MAG: YesL family protein [Angelakisella sp.]|nr:YesL family protein [Angelakisella sp.]
MGLFSANFDRPGPGIPKDAPKKKGVALFIDILGREFWSLLQLNLIYLLCCLPIITIGPATAALSRTTVTMVRDENVYPIRDFKEAFQKNWKQGILFGILSTIVVGLQLWSLLLILAVGTQDSSMSWVLGPILVSSFFCVGIGMYIFPMIAYVQLPSKSILRNAVFLAFLGKGRTLAAMLLVGGLNMALILLWPMSMIFAVVIHFSLTSLLTSMFAWPVIQKYVVNSNQAKHGEEEEE